MKFLLFSRCQQDSAIKIRLKCFSSFFRAFFWDFRASQCFESFFLDIHHSLSNREMFFSAFCSFKKTIFDHPFCCLFEQERFKEPEKTFDEALKLFSLNGA